MGPETIMTWFNTKSRLKALNMNKCLSSAVSYMTSQVLPITQLLKNMFRNLTVPTADKKHKNVIAGKSITGT